MPAKGRCPVASLGDDLAVEILSRLPIRSLYRSKCVSKAWRNLIAHPDHRRKLPQTLAGFFHGNLRLNLEHADRNHLMPAIDFVNLSGEKGTPLICPSLAFLPAEYHKGIVFLDCCNGLLLLLLCRSASSDPRYIVCNPATEKWVALPASTSTSTFSPNQQHAAGGNMPFARLGFDPAVSPHFHVVEFAGVITAGLEVYSSKTGAWETSRWATSRRGWSGGHGDYMFSFLYSLRSPPAFLNGCLHFRTSTVVAAIDMESKTWREIPFADTVAASVAQLPGSSLHVSQGRLHYANYEMDRHGGVRFAVYVLNDDDGCGESRSRWTLKHSVGIEHLFGGRRYAEVMMYKRAAMHPDCNLIFFIDRRDNALTSYDMDRRIVQVVRNIGPDSRPPYVPYVPFYSQFAHGSST